MTTLTVSGDRGVESSEQEASEPTVAAATRVASMRFTSGPSAQEIGHVDGDGASGAARCARPAVPTLVDVHEGLAVLRIDRQRVQWADLHAQRAALDAQRLVDGDRYVYPLVDQRHEIPLSRLPRSVIRSPRIRMYSRSTGLPSSRCVSRSSNRTAAPSGACRRAAVWASAATASTARAAVPRRWPVASSMSAKMSLVSNELSRTAAPMSGAR